MLRAEYIRIKSGFTVGLIMNYSGMVVKLAWRGQRAMGMLDSGSIYTLETVMGGQQ